MEKDINRCEQVVNIKKVLDRNRSPWENPNVLRKADELNRPLSAHSSFVSALESNRFNAVNIAVPRQFVKLSPLGGSIHITMLALVLAVSLRVATGSVVIADFPPLASACHQ